MNGATFIPNFGQLEGPIGYVEKPFPIRRWVTVIEDYRIRLAGEPLPGDYCKLKDGSDGVVTAVRTLSDGSFAICAAPFQLINRAAFLDGRLYLERSHPISVFVVHDVQPDLVVKETQ